MRPEAYLRYVIILVSLIIAPSSVVGQDAVDSPYPLRTDTLSVVGGGPFLVRPLMLPGTETVWLNGTRLADLDYALNERSGSIFFPHAGPDEEFILIISYRFIPVSFPNSFRKWPSGQPAPDLGRRSPARNSAQRDSRASTTGREPILTKSGSITRGITAGSQRDVAVESGLRMQVEGEILEGLHLRAALTDENTPILPEGNTQRLNEFDRVFIELRSKVGTVQLGDFDTVVSGGEFALLNRKLQGATVFGVLPSSISPSYAGGSFLAAGATSRGVFRVQNIEPVDGIQGPYRLEGADGERFIIVIPGSEVVYIDGQRMTRGETRDYTVDYTTGELTFTPARVISSDRRITIEFQYTTNQFTRTLLAVDVNNRFGENANGNALLELGVSILREGDGNQFNEEFGLTSEDSLAIAQSGDSDAVRSGAVEVSYDPEALFTQYVTEDVQDGSGARATIFTVVRSLPPDSVRVFRVTFSRVGSGNGSYRRTGQATNGIVYEYVGDGQGEYDPVRRLPKPFLQQLVDLRAVVRPAKGFSITGEWGASVLDRNRMSSIDSADDTGNAYSVRARLESMSLEIGSRTIGRLSANVLHRWRNEDFTTFDRVRPVEYARRWNIQDHQIDATTGIQGTGAEAVSEAAFVFAWKDSSKAAVSIANLSLDNFFEGRRTEASVQILQQSFPGVRFRIERINSDDRGLGQTGTWIRQFGRIEDDFWQDRLNPFLEIEYENLNQRDVVTGELVSPSIRYSEIRAGTTWREDIFSVSAQVERRDEEMVQEDGLNRPFDAWTLTSAATYDPSANLHTGLSLGFRTTSANSQPASGQSHQSSPSDESLILRWNGRWRAPGAGTNLTWMYQAQTERTAALQEIYIRTGQERGEYVWVDENGDGVIQLEEFIPETTPEEGLYVRTYFPSDSLESVTSVKGRIRLDYRPGRPGGIGSTSLSRFVKGIGLVSLLDFEEKSRDPVKSNLYLVKLNRFRSTAHTLNGRIRARQEVSFFRHIPGLDASIILQEARSLTALAAGEDVRLGRLLQFNGRYRISTSWNARLSMERTRDKIESQSFSTRNYDILTTQISPSIMWSISRRLFLTLASVIAHKSDNMSGSSGTVVQFPLEARYRLERRMDLTGRFEVADVNLSSEVRGLTEFEMTEGRGSGTSFLWRLALQSNLSEVLTASLTYDGRSPADAPVVHTARFQLSARF